MCFEKVQLLLHQSYMIKSKKLKYSTYECPQNRILICKIQDKHYSVIKIVLHYVTIITINP